MIEIRHKMFCDCLEELQTEEELETGECKLCKFGSSLNTISKNIQKRFPVTKWKKGLELIEAGISEIVCIKETYYDSLSEFILKEWIEAGGKFRVMRI